MSWRVRLLGLAGAAAFACTSGPTAPSSASAACTPHPASANAVLPVFGRPFDGAFPIGNFFDHDKPIEGGANGYVLTLCGTRDTSQVDGHPGYDWRMPEGTPLLAVAYHAAMTSSESSSRRAVALAITVLLVNAALPRGQAPQSVDGVVYEDANGNGRRDAGERGVAGIAVSDQYQVVRSGADGAYRLAGLGTGVVFVSISDGLGLTSRFWQPVTLSSDGRVDFGVTPRQRPSAFSFIHASDTHVSPKSVNRLRQVRDIVATRRPDFVLVTGDLVRDALRVSEAEARGYYDLYVNEIDQFPVPVWSVPGNHENFGIERHLSLVSSAHPLYGKGMYRQRLGPNYYSFSYGGVHFVGLDSVDIADLWYYGHIDDRQLAWLRADLGAVAADMPVVTFNHIPFVSAVDMIGGYQDDGPAPTLIKLGDRTVFRHVVSNFKDVAAVLQARDWPLALGGHFHTRESIRYESPVRTRFEQAAAVVGPTTNVVPAISGVTLYRVKNRVIDGGEFIRLQ